MHNTILCFKLPKSCRGVQKTDEPNKPAETNQTEFNFSVWFRFHFLKIEIFGFGVRYVCTESTETEPNNI